MVYVQLRCVWREELNVEVLQQLLLHRFSTMLLCIVHNIHVALFTTVHVCFVFPLGIYLHSHSLNWLFLLYHRSLSAFFRPERLC